MWWNEYLAANTDQNIVHLLNPVPIHYRRQSAAFGPTPTTLEGQNKHSS